MPYLGKPTPEIQEQQMFSILNMLIKRNFYSTEMVISMTRELKKICKAYSQ